MSQSQNRLRPLEKRTFFRARVLEHFDLHKKEIIKLKNVVAQKGLTIVPLKAYFKRGIAKIEFATARGKKMYQKKESLKIKDLDREAKREMRER